MYSRSLSSVATSPGFFCFCIDVRVYGPHEKLSAALALLLSSVLAAPCAFVYIPSDGSCLSSVLAVAASASVVSAFELGSSCVARTSASLYTSSIAPSFLSSFSVSEAGNFSSSKTYDSVFCSTSRLSEAGSLLLYSSDCSASSAFVLVDSEAAAAFSSSSSFFAAGSVSFTLLPGCFPPGAKCFILVLKNWSTLCVIFRGR